MEHFNCPECDEAGILTIVEITEEETIDGTTLYMGECPRHDDVSTRINWRNE